ncbi:MAG: hypothetical protein QF471_00380 [Phycisphaerales bacterium]|jgi:hypothetical protein|nr:hypothetical protein [Phycisphaerales bacterium]
MRVSPTTKVSTFKRRFREEFGVDIKCHKGNSLGHIADDDDKLHEICTKQDHDRDFKLDLHGNHKVGSAEKDIAESLGFKVQLLMPDGSNAKNSMTLSELRKEFEGGGKPAASPARPSSAAKPAKAGKSGCLIGMILAPFI